MPTKQLTVQDHRRDSANLRYVYPVLSRRAEGVSIGINLNTNNACNWRCIYCQVPELSRGSAPVVDPAQLRGELRRVLHSIRFGDFFDRFEVPEHQRVVRDIAISGNGEPTSAAEFPAVVDAIGEIVAEAELSGRIKLVLITNGSLARRATVRTGLSRWAALGGEAWFKLDRVSEESMLLVNGVRRTHSSLIHGLSTFAELCTTWIQTCLFAVDGIPPSETELNNYLEFLAERIRGGTRLRGVLLYGLARPSLQPEAERLSCLSPEWLDAFANRVRKLGLEVRVHP